MRGLYKTGLLVLLFQIIYSQPASWISRGIGGGGALYSPSINPANDNEYYVGCDMSDLFHTTDFGNSYTTINHLQIQGGHNSTVRFTNNPSLIYAISYKPIGGSDMVLPVKSTDGGATWSALPGNPDPSEETFSINADYNNPQRLIISYYGAVYFSSNGGNNFANIHNAANNGAGVLVGGAFFDNNNIYVGTNDGLLVSTSGGTSFSVSNISGINPAQRIFSFTGAKQGSITRFFCLTADSIDIYVGISGTDYWDFMKGVYTLDYGSGNWIQRMNGISVGTDFIMFAASAQNDISTAYLAGSNSSGLPNILKTTNGGMNWSRVFNTTSNQNIYTGWSGQGGDRSWGYGECALGVSVSPANINKVIFSDLGFVHKTTNGGAMWYQAYVASADQNPAGSNTPVGKNYHGIGLENTSCWQLLWRDSLNLFSGFSDIKCIRSTDAGSSWSFNYTGLNANSTYRLAKHPVTGTLFAATSNIHDMYQSTRLTDNILDANDAEGKILYSTNGGSAWQLMHFFNHPVFWIALDPNNQNRMYASVIHSTLGGIYISNNIQNLGASSWTKLANPPRTEGHPASIAVLNDGKMVCTFSGRRTSSFTASSGTFIYNPQLNSWTDISHTGMYYWTKDIVVYPYDVNQNTFYVCVFSGWGGPPNGLGGLYRTTNRGSSWTKINNQDRVTSVTFSPVNQNIAYITTETQGLWYSANVTSATPAFLQLTSYPFKQPERVFFNPYNNNEVWVTSFGGGLRVGSIISGIHQISSEIPEKFELKQNYPNPFNPSTNFEFSLPKSSYVKIVIYNILGKEISILVNNELKAGTYKIDWDGENYSSGAYLYTLESEGFTEVKKMVLLK
jgi:photosystem II stability/assembly factor-like uncharacterized protein